VKTLTPEQPPLITPQFQNMPPEMLPFATNAANGESPLAAMQRLNSIQQQPLGSIAPLPNQYTTMDMGASQPQPQQPQMAPCTKRDGTPCGFTPLAPAAPGSVPLIPNFSQDVSMGISIPRSEPWMMVAPPPPPAACPKKCEEDCTNECTPDCCKKSSINMAKQVQQGPPPAPQFSPPPMESFAPYFPQGMNVPPVQDPLQFFKGRHAPTLEPKIPAAVDPESK